MFSKKVYRCKISVMKNSERSALTRQRIHQAFINLRKRKSLEQIRVTELCRMADTNRTTFYHYYEDIYCLNNDIENQFLKECLDGFPYRGLAYEDPDRFLMEFNRALSPHKKELDILAHGRESDQFIKIEEWMVNLAKKDNQSIEEEFFLTFMVGGLVHMLNYYRKKKKYSEEMIREQMTKLMHKGLRMNNNN